MKKNIIGVALAVVSILGLTSPLFAASLNLSSATTEISAGKTFTVTVKVNPESASIYTAKVHVSFPSDLLQINSFVFAGTWMPLSQPGYDTIDNTSGALIKTAGYPGGLSATATVGTITFKAKKAGDAVVTVAGDSLALDASNNNTFTGGTKVSVKIDQAVVAPTGMSEVSPSASATPEPSVIQITPVASSQSLAAAIGGILALGTNSGAIAVIFTLVLVGALIAIGFYLGRRSRM